MILNSGKQHPCGIMNLEFLGEQVKLTYFNETAATMLGYTRNEFKEIITNNHLDMLAKGDKDDFIARINIALGDKKDICPYIYRLICKDGSYKNVQIFGNLLSDVPQSINIVMIDTYAE